MQGALKNMDSNLEVGGVHASFSLSLQTMPAITRVAHAQFTS